MQHRLGVQRGDRVLLVSQNCPQWVVAFQAVLRAGAVVVPVNPMSKAEEIAFLAADSGARVAIVAQSCCRSSRWATAAGSAQVAGAAYADAIDAGSHPGWPTPARRVHARAGRHWRCPPDTSFEAPIAAGLSPSAAGRRSRRAGLLPYTSGTTGRPRAAATHTPRCWLRWRTSAAGSAVHAGSVVLTVAPLFHMLGLQNGMNLPLISQGATTVMLPRWDARAAGARLIERHRVSAWSAPPAMVMDLFADPAPPGATSPA
jgi:fatty-acyl-CoA synthase